MGTRHVPGPWSAGQVWADTLVNLSPMSESARHNGTSVVTFGPDHVQSAADLVLARLAHARSLAPALPDELAAPDVLAGVLADAQSSGLGIAAIRGGEVVGLMAGYLLEDQNEQPSVICPEWANGAGIEGDQDLYEDLYRAASQVWAAGGAGAHMVMTQAAQACEGDALEWLGFGRMVVDAVRDLGPVAGRPMVSIRHATPDDVEGVARLYEAMSDDLRMAPVFNSAYDEPDPAEIALALTEECRALLIAECSGEPAGFVTVGPVGPDACTVVRGVGTAGISALYTCPEWRRRGIASALLDEAASWCAASCYARLSVYFEPMNIASRRFWLKHFTPVCQGYARTIR